jgi:hypothetical protein
MLSLRIADDIQCQRPKTQKDTNYRPLGFSPGKKKYTAGFSDIVRTPSSVAHESRILVESLGPARIFFVSKGLASPELSRLHSRKPANITLWQTARACGGCSGQRF